MQLVQMSEFRIEDTFHANTFHAKCETHSTHQLGTKSHVCLRGSDPFVKAFFKTGADRGTKQGLFPYWLALNKALIASKNGSQLVGEE